MLYKLVLSVILVIINYLISRSKINLKLFAKILISILLPIIGMYGFKVMSENDYSATSRLLYFIFSLSFGLIWLKYIFEFISYFMNLNIFSIKTKSQENQKYFVRVRTIVVSMIFPAIVTMFQLILIWMPERVDF
jgi:hypothetical protein